MDPGFAPANAARSCKKEESSFLLPPSPGPRLEATGGQSEIGSRRLENRAYQDQIFLSLRHSGYQRTIM